jgi:hypothetical protein
VAVSSPQQILAAIYDVVSVESDRLDNAEPVPEDLYVSSIRQGNRDVFAEGLQIMKGENTLQLLVRAGAGLVQGKVSNKGGQVVHHAAVVLLPEAKAGRTRPLIAYRQGRTDQNGRFELRGIIPGTYRIYAWANLRPNEFMDSDFISKFENRGRLLQIRERDRASMDLFVLDEQ